MTETFLSHANAAQLNRSAVFRFIKKNGPISRTDIWENMNISRASVTQVIRQLQEANLIIETQNQQKGAGRISRLLSVNGNARCMFAFDWMSRMLCLINLDSEILASIHLNFAPSCTPSAFAAVIQRGMTTLRQKHPIQPSDLLGLGITLPGLVDSRRMIALYSVELGWRDVNIRDLFRASFGDAVFLEQTGNMLALGECVYGAGKGFDHAMLVLLDEDGIGAATVIRGDCQHGSNYMYGELGHVKLPSDVMCSCGQRGCLEAIVRNHLMNNGGQMDDELIDYLSFGVSTAVNISDPGIILLSGSLVENLTPAQNLQLIECIRQKVTNVRSRSLTIHICKSTEMMAIRGLGAYIFNHHFNL